MSDFPTQLTIACLLFSMKTGIGPNYLKARTPPLYDELARRGMKAFDNSIHNGICRTIIIENDACRTQSEGKQAI